MPQVCTTHEIPPNGSITVISITTPALDNDAATPSSTNVTDNGGNSYTITNTSNAAVTQTWCVGDPHVTTLSGETYTL